MFIWKKEFELGIRSIDEQHKELLKIGNKINEMLQDKYQYPGTISHIKEHREFIDFIDDFEFNNLSDHKDSKLASATIVRSTLSE